MRIDPLQQYAKLRQQLLQEKSTLEARLGEINQVLGAESTTVRTGESPSSRQQPAPSKVRRGRGPTVGNTMSLREAVLKALANGPLARKELVKAVQGVGYKFATKNPLNSIGSVLYGKNSAVKNKAGKFYLQGSAFPDIAAKSGSRSVSAKPIAGARIGRKKRTMSPEAREKIAAAQRARWAKQRRGR